MGGVVNDRLTLATSAGLPFLSLAFHVALGVSALVAGSMAIAARKGGKWHRRIGLVFVYTMIATGITAAGISVYEGKSAGGGIVTAYLVFTGFTAVKPLPAAGRQVDIVLMLLAITLGLAGYPPAFEVLGMPGSQRDGVPAGMLFFMTTIVLLAGIGDLRMILARGIRGTKRIARHLWRMCFGLFIATGSFAGQLASMDYLPGAFRNITTVLVLSAAPIVALLYWMWRVRWRGNVRGLMTSEPIEAAK